MNFFESLSENISSMCKYEESGKLFFPFIKTFCCFLLNGSAVSVAKAHMPKFGIEIAIAVKCLSFSFDLTELWALENHVLSMKIRVLFLPAKVVKGAVKRICCEQAPEWLHSTKPEKDSALEQEERAGPKRGAEGLVKRLQPKVKFWCAL